LTDPTKLGAAVVGWAFGNGWQDPGRTSAGSRGGDGTLRGGWKPMASWRKAKRWLEMWLWGVAMDGGRQQKLRWLGQQNGCWQAWIYVKHLQVKL